MLAYLLFGVMKRHEYLQSARRKLNRNFINNQKSEAKANRESFGGGVRSLLKNEGHDRQRTARRHENSQSPWPTGKHELRQASESPSSSSGGGETKSRTPRPLEGLQNV